MQLAHQRPGTNFVTPDGVAFTLVAHVKDSRCRVVTSSLGPMMMVWDFESPPFDLRIEPPTKRVEVVTTRLSGRSIWRSMFILKQHVVAEPLSELGVHQLFPLKEWQRLKQLTEVLLDVQ